MKIKTILVLLGIARLVLRNHRDGSNKGSKVKVIQAAPYYEMKFLKRADLIKYNRRIK